MVIKILCKSFIYTLNFLLFLILFVIIGEIISTINIEKTKNFSGESFVLKRNEYISVHPAMIRVKFNKTKDNNEFRIFVLGSSQAMGVPYAVPSYDKVASFFNLVHLPNEGGISTWLEQYFKVIMPASKITVINAACSGMDMENHLKVFKEIIDIGNHDLVIFMAGNNERNMSPLVKIENFNAPFPSVKEIKIIRSKFKEIINYLLNHYYNYAKEVKEIAEKKQIKVYFVTVPSNIRDWKPTDLIDFNERQITTFLNSGNYNEALQILKNKHYEQNSLRLFYIAKCYDKIGYYEKAKMYYLSAKDQDKSFLRCRSRFNNVVRSLGGKYVKIIDLENTISKYSKNNIAGNDFFFDYCHFKIKGNILAAKEICKYYISENNFPDIYIEKINKARLKGWSSGQLYALYLIKLAKWTKYEILSGLQGKDTRYIKMIKDNTKKSMEEIVKLSRISSDMENLFQYQ